MKKWLNEITLSNDLVELQPLSIAHKDALTEAASDGELWQLWFTSVPEPTQVEAYIQTALDGLANQTMLPFVVVRKSDNKIVGCTRFANADATTKRIEIGYTWYAKSTQRTGINTACKYLLLQHAFETLDCIAVEFRTHWHNQASRKAIARLGAKQDGVLRNHKIDKSGNVRDTVVFSILNSEWQVVKQSLGFKMSAYK